MGDEPSKYFTIQVKGEAMRFTPIPDDEAKMVATLVAMDAGQSKIFKGLMAVLRRASSEEQWERLSDRVVSLDVRLEDIMNVFKRLTERTRKDAETTGGLDVASTELSPVDAE